VYEVTTEPPFEAGSVKATVAVRFPVTVATTDAGAPGAVFAAEVVMELEAADADEVPTEFKAATVKVYAVAGDKPVTEIVPEVA
jgi:hypothetical protein